MTSRSEAARPDAPAGDVGEASLRAYLATCRELAELCTQNGWPDDRTLTVDLLERGPAHLVAAVTFEEVIMEGAGCVAGTVPCYGRVRAEITADGTVRRLEIL
jgi:hypothetical protein